ncbi:hypothetical protein HZH66_010048 [Vespula vulgaris]|uniref:Uncharacterized protein n=1 Tax=Vespula vulgaris TaxID=7454 RepID=A0A834JI76_VESVU|nr:hypothetical protein HZH66_010048 [Vespula vulgaris]
MAESKGALIAKTVQKHAGRAKEKIRNENEDSRVEEEEGEEEEEEEEVEEVEEEIEKEEDGAVDREPLENTSKVLGSAIDQLRTNAGSEQFIIHTYTVYNVDTKRDARDMNL